MAQQQKPLHEEARIRLTLWQPRGGTQMWHAYRTRDKARCKRAIFDPRGIATAKKPNPSFMKVCKTCWKLEEMDKENKK